MPPNQTKWKKLKITWILFLWMGWTFSGAYASQEQQSPPSKEAIQAQLLNFPLSFESNEGQTDQNVKYLVRGQGCTMFFTPQNLVMTFNQNQSSSILKMQFLDANPNPQIKGLEEQGHKTNYFIKNDAKKWRSNISNYKKICYQEVYPGIDVVFYGNGRQLEYDICVAPNSNPNQARFQIEGAEKLFIDEKGNLRIVVTDQNEIQMQRPFVYQVIEGNQVTVDSQFQLLAGNEVGFELGNYNPSYLLVIDPVLGYSTYLGGASSDTGNAIAVDSSGNVFITGSTTSLNFPITPGAFQSTIGGSTDAFIAKINPTGSTLIYSTYLGGTAVEVGSSIAIDSAGNAYITGPTFSSDFPITPGAFQTTNPALQATFITKLDPLGQSLVYSTYLSGNTGSTSGNGIAIDGTANAYIVGSTNSPSFPTTPGAFQTLHSGSTDGFITKLNSTGTALVYSTFLGGSQGDNIRSIAIDGAGNAYVTGETNSSNFPITPGAFQTFLQGSNDGFITKLNSTGANLDFSTYLGGTGFDFSRSIAIDSLGNSYVTGNTFSSDFPITPMAFQTTLLGASDAFITKLNPTGTALVYSTYLGGTGDETGFSIALDGSNNAYVSGNTTSTDFPVTPDAFQSIHGGLSDAFITQINASGNDLIYSTYFGGTDIDASLGINVDSNQNIYIVGSTGSTNFPITPGVFQETYGGGTRDAYIARFITSTTTTLNVSPNPANFGQMVTLTTIVSPSAATGTVSFYDGVTLLSTVPVVGGVAVFSTDTFTVGVHSLTAEYSGDANYDGSISAPVNLVINTTATTTTLNVSPNPADFGQMVSLTATISPSAATGTVSFYDGVTLLSTVPVVGGVAVFATDTFSVGVHSLTAEYSGDASFDGSTSVPVNLVINSPVINTFTTLVTTPNPVFAGQPVIFTVTVSPSNATGTVSVFSGSNLLGTAVVVNGTATIVITAPGIAGIFPIIAIYSGDANFSSSSSVLTFLAVEQPSVLILPPRHLRGLQIENRFATQSDIINVLKWKVPSSRNQPVAYRIYRENLDHLIAIVNANQSLVYEDHNRRKGKKYLYYVISEDEFGNLSEPASIVIK